MATWDQAIPQFKHEQIVLGLGPKVNQANNVLPGMVVMPGIVVHHVKLQSLMLEGAFAECIKRALVPQYLTAMEARVDDQTESQISRRRRSRPRKVSLEGRDYIALKAAAKLMGVSHTTLYQWAEKGITSNGMVLDLLTDTVFKQQLISVACIEEFLRSRFKKSDFSQSLANLQEEISGPSQGPDLSHPEESSSTDEWDVTHMRLKGSSG